MKHNHAHNRVLVAELRKLMGKAVGGFRMYCANALVHQSPRYSATRNIEMSLVASMRAG